MWSVIVGCGCDWNWWRHHVWVFAEAVEGLVGLVCTSPSAQLLSPLNLVGVFILFQLPSCCFVPTSSQDICCKTFFFLSLPSIFFSFSLFPSGGKGMVLYASAICSPSGAVPELTKNSARECEQ